MEKKEDIKPINLYEIYLGEKNKSYYLQKFEALEKKGGGFKVGWNWAAFFFDIPWALYRKMYEWFYALLVIRIIFIEIESIFIKKSSLFSLISYWAVSFLFALFANSLYYNNIKKKIALAQLRIKDHAELVCYLRYTGGVNKWLIWLLLGFLGIALIAIFFTILRMNFDIKKY